MNRTLRSRAAVRYGVSALLAAGLIALLTVLAGAGSAASSAAPVNTSPPTLSGTPQEGQILTTDPGSYSGTTPITYVYQYRRCDKTGGSCSDIGGTTQTPYQLTSADVGNTVRVRVTATNTDGSTTATSVPTAIIQAASSAAPVNTSPPTLSGTPQEGQTLTASPGSYSGTTPITYVYQYLRCDRTGGNCTDSGQSTSQNFYRLTSADVGNTIRVRVAASNKDGSTAATSVPTAVIQTATVTPSGTAPKNTSPPTLSGTPQEGQTLGANPGTYSGTTPITYVYQYRRCDKTGGSCSDIGGSTRQNAYKLTSADVGNTVRVRVTATNNAGSITTTSVPTAVIKKASVIPPPVTNGCPSGEGTIQIRTLSPPARLAIDGQQASPSVIRRSTNDLVLRFHVSACRGRGVQGALVYATAVPFAQFSVQPEATTGADGYATLTLHQASRFPASSRQQLLVVFVRARKPGESLTGGISTRLLVSFPVNL